MHFAHICIVNIGLGGSGLESGFQLMIMFSSKTKANNNSLYVTSCGHLFVRILRVDIKLMAGCKNLLILFVHAS